MTLRAVVAVGLCLASLPAFAAPVKMTPNEQKLRHLINLIVPKADRLKRNEYQFVGVSPKGNSCFVRVNTHKIRTFKATPNNTSFLGLEASAADIKDGFHTTFDGEGPNGIAGKPTTTVGVQGQNITIQSNDADRSSFPSDRSLTMGFAGNRIETLSAFSGITTFQGDPGLNSQATCQRLRFLININEDMDALIEKQINANLRDGFEVELMNGCNIDTRGQVLTCGFAVDEENDHQGEARFRVNPDRSLNPTPIEVKLFPPFRG